MSTLCKNLLEDAENTPQLCCGDESAPFQMSAPGGRTSSNKNAMVVAREYRASSLARIDGRFVFIVPTLSEYI